MIAGRRARRGLRGRLLATVLTTIAIVLAALTAGFNLVLSDRLGTEAAGVAGARATAELAALHVQGSRIVLPDAPDQGSPDTSVWVFQRTGGTLRPIETPQSVPLSTDAVARLAAAAPAELDLERPPLRLRAVPVQPGGRPIGAVVAAVSLTPYDQSRRTALIASSVLALLALIAVGVACRWLIGRALQPVARMTRQADEWSEHEIDRRFDLGEPRDEIGQLAATLDGLLSRLAAALRHEQRLTSELSHELRTPLAGIRAQAQYAVRHTVQDGPSRQALQEILAATRRMSDTLDTLIAAARADLNPSQNRGEAVAAARAAAASATAARGDGRGIRITVAAEREPLPVVVEQPLIERILAPLLDNAFRYARHEVSIHLSAEGRLVSIAVSDDGPGIAEADLEAVFEPGWQGATPGHAPVAVQGTGLGLALVRRLARSAGGDVQAQHAHEGTRFVVSLPAAG